MLRIAPQGDRSLATLRDAMLRIAPQGDGAMRSADLRSLCHAEEHAQRAPFETRCFASLLRVTEVWRPFETRCFASLLRVTVPCVVPTFADCVMLRSTRSVRPSRRDASHRSSG